MRGGVWVCSARVPKYAWRPEDSLVSSQGVPGSPPSLSPVEKRLLAAPPCNRIGTFEVNRQWERKRLR